MREFIDYLSVQGADRYFSFPRQAHQRVLFDLDRAIWHVRRYCQPVLYLREYGPKLQDKLSEYLIYLNSPQCLEASHRFRLLRRGHLEIVLDTDKFLSQRAVLIWKNFHYGRRKRRRVRGRFPMWCKSPEHLVVPELFPYLKEKVAFSQQMTVQIESALVDE